ncbi:MAG: hypothetical protein XD96_1705 [Petrotoga mobilis]|nr:MAG: hypothetical protein XD96_1705 [Petrotoga mobilis]
MANVPYSSQEASRSILDGFSERLLQEIMNIRVQETNRTDLQQK